MNPRIAELLEQINQRANEVKKIWDEAGNELPTGEVKQRIITLNKEIEEREHEVKELREAAEQRAANDARLKRLNEPVGGPRFPGQPGGAKASDAPDRRPLGERFITSPDFKDYMGRVAAGGRIPDGARIHSPAVPVKSIVGVKTLVTGVSDTQAGALVYNDQTSIVVPSPFRPFTLLDLITIGQTSSDTVEYVRVTGYTNNAAPVAEATATSGGSGVKPESALALVRVTEAVKTIAHWVPATRRALADAGQLRTLIDTFLRDGLMEEMEDQIVNGSGSGENFTGLTNVVGRTTQAWDTNILTTTRKARTLVRTTGRAMPTGYLFAPADWETIDLLQDNEGRYFFGGPSVIGQPRLWGLPVAESEAVTAGEGFVGDFRQCVLWMREEANILVSDSHSDFFIRNLLAILGEERAAFGVLRPAAIVEIDTAA